MSIVRPKRIRTVHYCEETKVGMVREYNDEYDLA